MSVEQGTVMNEQTMSGAEEAPDEPQDTEPSEGIDLSRVRDLVLAANPDVVPEMVQGETFDALMESIESAREAYQRIASQTARERSTPNVAAQPGQRRTTIVDIEMLSPLGKISEGLRRSG